MNTPAHVIASLLVVGRAERATGPVALGAVLPDLPMVVFYGYQKLVAGTAEAVIWGERYFAPQWQDFFDVPNSIPLILLGLGLARIGGWQRGVWLFASMGVHTAFDLPLHHDDAHRHFYPLSDWRFESPLSYWDPRHYGRWFGLAEIAGVVAGGAYLWRARPAGGVRGIVALCVGAYALFIAFALVVWL